MATINKIPKCPPLRFPDFNDDWKETTLGEVAEITSGYSGEQEQTETPYRVSRIETISSGVIDIDRVGFVPYDARLEEYKLSLGDILFSNINSIEHIGKSAIVRKPVDLYHGMNLLRLKAINIDPYALYYHLQRDVVRNRFRSIANKAVSQASINQTTLGKEVILFASSLSEQKKIADFLSLIDERINNLSETLRELKNQKAALLNQLFSQKLRFPDFDDEWTQTTLGDIGKTYPGLSGKSSEDFGKGSPYITYKMVYDGVKINLCNTEYVYVSESEKQNQVRLGDILFTTSSETPEETGLCSVLLSSCDELYLNSFCFGYRLNEENLATSIFLGYALRSPIYRMKLSTLAQGSTRYNISKSEVMRMAISLPSLEEQKKIADFLSLVDERIEVEEQLLKKYEEQKKYLLRHMFV